MKQFCLAVALAFTCVVAAQSEITVEELKQHITFLTSEENQGRFPGSVSNKQIVGYLEGEFKASGLKSFGKDYKQEFETKLRLDSGSTAPSVVKTWNVVGYLPGSDKKLKNEWIVLGAHYDHLGLGNPSSKSKARGVVYHGADDNASGTAALLEIAEKLAVKKLKKSVIFVAFGAEEQGLVGSRYFTNNPPVPLNHIKLMINMDMVGRLNTEKHVYMGGAGTFPNGVDLMTSLGKELGLNPIVHAGSVGGSDHVSFYLKDKSVLGLHTGGHDQYHRPEDVKELINYEGEKLVCEYVYQAILNVAGDWPMQFIKQD